MKKILAILGTNSQPSTNRKLLQFIQSHFKTKASIDIAEIGDLPIFVKDTSLDLPPIVENLCSQIEAADGLIIATPEYNHAVPAVLMNALNWLSFKRHPLTDKATMIVGASYGTLGSSRAQMHLRQILNSPEIKARQLPGDEFLLGHSLQAFDSNDQLVNAEDIRLLETIFNDFLYFIELNQQLSQVHEIER